MRSLIFLVFPILFLGLLSACSTAFLRLPASIRVNYDAEKVRLLTGAAKEGILFQFDDEFLKEIPKAEILDNCTFIDDGQWGENFYSILKVFDRHPDLYKKFHAIQFKKGDRPNIELNREWDGAILLSLSYQKVQVRQPISDDWRKKCSSFGDNRDQVTLHQLDWPSPSTILETVQKFSEKNVVPRFQFNNGFLVFLAEHLTVFRLDASLAGERSLQGQAILPEVMNKLSAQVKSTRYPYIDFWLQEIDQKSKLGRQLKFFNIVQDQKLGHGIALDGPTSNVTSSFKTNLNQQPVSTYLFLSFRSRTAEYQYSNLGDLEKCIEEFNPYMSSTYLSKPERFLHPGYSCERQEP